MTSTTHWAAGFIGLPYRRGASGPQAYDCWALVRAALWLRWRCELPALDDGAGGVPGIVAAARAQGWHRLPGAGAADGDVLCMRHAQSGWAHVGLAVAAGRRVAMLHASEADGRVCVAPVEALPALGYAEVCVWRRAS